jgi:hypothetical protein
MDLAIARRQVSPIPMGRFLSMARRWPVMSARVAAHGGNLLAIQAAKFAKEDRRALLDSPKQSSQGDNALASVPPKPACPVRRRETF